jgi:hypothetical protein
VQVCRLDGYLEQGTERPVVLENNADAPAGSLFTSRINQLVADVLSRLGVDPGPASPLTYTGENSLLGVLALGAAQAGLDEPAHVAILQPTGSITKESAEMTAAFSRSGVDAYIADPRDLEIRRGRVYFSGRPADACWNKINTAPWRDLVADEDLCARWVRAVSDTSFLHVNPFGARYVAESKLSLALPQEPAFSGLFTPAERALAVRMLPWGRQVTTRARAADEVTCLHADLAEHPARYVLKQPYDIRGDGVTIGRAVGRGAWQDAIEAALAHGHLAQEHIAPTSYPTLGEDTSVVAMPVSLDTFVLRGRARGFGSKASLNPRLNVFQGGQKLAVQVVREHCDAA